MAELVMIISLFVIAFKFSNSSSIKINKKQMILIGFLFFILVLSLFDFCFVHFSFYDFLILYLRLSFYVISLIIFSNYFDIEYGINILRKVTLLCCVLLVVQLFSFYIFKRPISFKIPFLTLDKPDTYTGIFIRYISGFQVLRTSSLFFEPAHFGYFVSIALAVELFLLENKNFKLCIFYSICIFISTSSGGILFCLIVWLYYFLRNLNFKNFVVIILSLFVVFIIYKALSNSFFVRFTVDKMTDIFSDNGVRSSRLSSLDYYNILDFRSKIMGIGFGNAEFYFSSSLMKFGYISSFVGLLIWNGLLGCIGVLFYFLRFYFLTNRNGRVFIIIFIVSLIGTAMLTSVNIIYFLIWSLACNKLGDV